MNNRKTILKLAAFASALALTAGVATYAKTSPAAFAPTTAYAEEAGTQGKSGALTYMKYSDHVEITQCDMSATSVEIPSSIDGVPVTKIGMYAFEVCSFTSITIPESVETIGGYCFTMCQKLEEVKLPSSLKVIELRAFSQCPKLSKVEFPDSMIEMHSYAFDETPWLEAQRAKSPLVIINGALIDGRTAKGDVVIPSEVKYVSSGAFSRNTDVTSVVYPEHVDKIADNAFFYCSNLTSVEAKGATAVESMAFAYCDKLSSLKLSEKLKTIEDYSFADAQGAATITFYGSQSSWEAVRKPANDQFLQRANVVFENYVPATDPVTEPTTKINPRPNDGVWGDVDGDRQVMMNDAVLIMQSISNPDKFGLNGTEETHITENGQYWGDVETPGNGITPKDALQIQKWLLQLVPSLDPKDN